MRVAELGERGRALSEEILEAMAKPDKNGTPTLPRRAAPKGMMPSTWVGRSVDVQYSDGYGPGQESSGTLLDLYPAGLIMSIAGTKTLIAWDRPSRAWALS